MTSHVCTHDDLFLALTADVLRKGAQPPYMHGVSPKRKFVGEILFRMK